MFWGENMNSKKTLLQLKKQLLYLAMVSQFSFVKPCFFSSYAQDMKDGLETTYENISTPSNAKMVSFTEEDSSLSGPGVCVLEEEMTSNEEKIEQNIDMEAKYQEVLSYYQMSEVDFLSFVKAVSKESLNSGNPLNQKQIITILYDLAKVSNDVKINYILAKYNINLDQLYKTGAVVLAESCNDGNNYVDAYGVTTVISNRVVSKEWKYCGNTIYAQAHKKGQFVVVSNGRSARYYGKYDRIGFQAFLDCLYMGAALPMHDHTSFRSWGSKKEGRIAYVTGGNRYFGSLDSEERCQRQGFNDSMARGYFGFDFELPQEQGARLELKM